MLKKTWLFGSFLVISATSAGVLVVACGDYPIASLQRGVDGPGGANGGELLPNTATPPCAVLGNAGHECVSAHSTVLVIVPDYAGPLYQVAKGGATLDIGAVDGYADGAAHDEFCGIIGCTFKIFYDQSGHGNHPTSAPPGSAKPTPANQAPRGASPVRIKGTRAARA